MLSRFISVVLAGAAADGQAVRCPGSVVNNLFCDMMERIARLERPLCRLRCAEARYAGCGTQARGAGSPLCRRGTEARGAARPLCWVWYTGALCGLPVVGSVAVCGA
jgi:hypothetical protein